MYLNELSHEEKLSFLSLANMVLLADGVAQDTEQLLISQFLEEMHLGAQDVVQITIDTAFRVFSFSTESIKRKVFIELVGLSMCDGEFDKTEIAILDNIARRFGFSHPLVQNMIRCVTDLLDIHQRLAGIVSV